MKYYAKVIEDNGGGLHLYVMDEADTCIYAHYGYEYRPGALREDIQALIDNDSVGGWEGCEENVAEAWEELDLCQIGLVVVAEVENGKILLCPERMGAAAKLEFGIERE